jgi:hypothetical protein
MQKLKSEVFVDCLAMLLSLLKLSQNKYRHKSLVIY